MTCRRANVDGVSQGVRRTTNHQLEVRTTILLALLFTTQPALLNSQPLTGKELKIQEDSRESWQDVRDAGGT